MWVVAGQKSRRKSNLIELVTGYEGSYFTNLLTSDVNESLLFKIAAVAPYLIFNAIYTVKRRSRRRNDTSKGSVFALPRAILKFILNKDKTKTRKA